MKNKLTSYVIITLITLTELVYFSYALFDKSNILLLLGTLLLLLLLTYISSLSKKFSLVYIIFSLLTIGLVTINYFDIFREYLNSFWILFINGEIHQSNIYMIFTVIYLNYQINLLIGTTIKTYYVQLIKTVGLISFIWVQYERQGVFLTMMITTLVIFIFLEAVASLFSKLVTSENTMSQILRISRYIFFIAVVITGLSLSTEDPLGFLDELDWFEEEAKQEFKQRLDAQNQIINKSNSFSYSDDTMLIVTTPFPTKIRGRAFDYYASTDWKISTALADQVVDYQVELENKMNLLTEYNVTYEEYELNILHKVYSQLLYAPLHSYIITSDDIESNAAKFYESETELNVDYEYSINAINIDYKTEEFHNLIRSLDVDLSQEEYLQLPNDINEDIRALTLEITKNSETPYDKIIAIEQYLARNHNYTKEPIQKPDYADYIDFFLFESQEGFCTHYASSMVIMLRSINIPARYVVGYAVVNNERDDRYYYEPIIEDFVPEETKTTTYYVNKDRSHAWVEVPFEEFGWLEFEPTSSYYTSMAIDAVEDLELIEPTLINDILNPEEPVVENQSNLPYIFLIFPVIIVVFGVYRRLRFTNEEKILSIWKRMSRKINRKQKVKFGNETIREYLNRGWVNKTLAQEVIKLFEKTCYSNVNTTTKDVERMKELLKQL